jgi:hypothetical protein
MIAVVASTPVNTMRRMPTMSADQLTAILAERVMGWSACPDRFLTGNRGWIRRGRFQPLVRIEDAFQLLDKTAATYKLMTNADGTFTAQVRVGGCTGNVSGEPKATAITLAIARALGIVAPKELTTKSSAGGTVRKGERLVR